MAKEHLSNDDFFQKLSQLFGSSNQGSIYLTQKCMSYSENADDGVAGESPLAYMKPSLSLPIIVRASNGKSKAKRDQKVKLSTIVEAGALETFFGKYAEVCKTSMGGLKKRDRSKAKEKLKAKKRKQGGAMAEVKK